MAPDGYRELLLAGVEARERYAPKRLVWLPAQLHIDLYDNDAFVGPAVEEVVTWFDAHVARPGAPA